MASESNDFFLKCNYLINILSINNEVCMRNISMERKFYRLQGGIKTIRLHNLIKHTYYLFDPWLRRLVAGTHLFSDMLEALRK